MQRGFSSIVLPGCSRFAESEFDDVATSSILAFNLLIYFLGQVAARLVSTVGSPSDGRGKWIVIAISGPPRLTWSRSNGRRRFSKNDDHGVIVSQSRRDRDSIVTWSGFLRGEIKTKRLPTDLEGDLEARSSRSWSDLGFFFEEKLKLTHRRFIAELKPQPMPTESLPRSHETASTTASIGHDLRTNFTL